MTGLPWCKVPGLTAACRVGPSCLESSASETSGRKWSSVPWEQGDCLQKMASTPSSHTLLFSLWVLSIGMRPGEWSCQPVRTELWSSLSFTQVCLKWMEWGTRGRDSAFSAYKLSPEAGPILGWQLTCFIFCRALKLSFKLGRTPHNSLRWLSSAETEMEL